MPDIGWVRHLAWEKDGDGIWEVDFVAQQPIPPGSDGGIEEFRREYKAATGYRSEAKEVRTTDQPEFTYRCGFQIEHSLNLLPDRPGAYRVYKGGQSNIIGEKFFDEINSDSDHAFVEFMTAALRPDFPHPFAMEE